jgi:GNAT superfamily N-acetyltransferase
VIGYVCGTRAGSSQLTHESMAQHHPDGPLLCLHSVCVAAEHRRKGVASAMLREYLQQQKQIIAVTEAAARVRAIALICKENLIPLYQGMFPASARDHPRSPLDSCWVLARWAFGRRSWPGSLV